MSFMLKLGGSDDKEQQLSLVRKRYFHNILQYNQQSIASRDEIKHIDRMETVKKFSKINEEALESLQKQVESKRRQKFNQQEILRLEYEKQIREKELKAKKEKELDKLYAKWQNQLSQSESERRVRQLMKIYDRATFEAIPKRAKTQSSKYQQNPEHAGHNSPSLLRKRQFSRSNQALKLVNEYDKQPSPNIQSQKPSLPLKEKKYYFPFSDGHRLHL